MKSVLLVFLAFVLHVPLNAGVNTLPQELYVQQEYSNTCTLSASVMMLRACLLQGESNCWLEVTESDLLYSAWTSEGLRWQWDYVTGENTLSVAHESISGTDEECMKAVLEEHPEGIVLYCGGTAHHGVYLCDYKDGIFYCADPAVGYAGGRIKLSDSLLGKRIGSQEEILQSVSAYWYISDSYVISDAALQTKSAAVVRNCP